MNTEPLSEILEEKMEACNMYYMERKGILNVDDIRISHKVMLNYFKDIYFYFYNMGYFDQAFDRADPIMVPSPAAYFFAHTGKSNVYPIHESYHRYDKDTLFTVVEILHKYIRKDEIDYEGNSNSTQEAQLEFRTEINKFLRFYEEGFELTVKGWISSSLRKGIDEIIHKNLPENAYDEVTMQVETAIKMFFHFSTNNEQKKKAINILADILEPLREEIKSLTLKEHDKMIFGIVNTCKIRHNNDKQMDDYHNDVWYEWMFHYYLATVHAVLRLKS